MGVAKDDFSSHDAHGESKRRFTRHNTRGGREPGRRQVGGRPLQLRSRWYAGDSTVGVTIRLENASAGYDFAAPEFTDKDIAELEREGPRILLVDDEKSMQDILGVTLQSAGYDLFPVSTGEEALRKFQLARPGLILLDLFLPDMDGKEVLRRLREWTSTPIVVMSVRHEESEKIACLDAGADDYLTKPFTMGELLARLRAALRRAFGSAKSEVFKAGDLRVDFNRREVFVGDDPAKLTATEYDLLTVLIHHAGLVRTHYQLIHELWGHTQYQDAVHLLRVTVSNLRRKLMRDPRIPRYIVTEPGVGYRLRTDAEWTQTRELQ